jgi:hypothetical protein
MTTFVADVGKVEQDQFAGLLQSELTVPCQEPAPEASKEMVTSSKLAVQGVFEIVQRRVAVVPEVMVMAALGSDVLEIETDPERTDHRPEPDVGLFADMVNVLLPHCDTSLPALAAVGLAFKVMVTSSLKEQAPFVMVQRNV